MYCAESRALAMLEILAHIGTKRYLRRAKFVAIPVDVPDDLITRPRSLPADWDRKPPADSTRRLGSRFLSDPAHPVLQVPSAVVAAEYCFVLNPAHPHFSRLLIGAAEPLDFDARVITADPPMFKPSAKAFAN